MTNRRQHFSAKDFCCIISISQLLNSIGGVLEIERRQPREIFQGNNTPLNTYLKAPIAQFAIIAKISR